MSLNEKITRMKRLRDDYRHLDAESKALKEVYKDLESQVIAELEDTEMTTAGNTAAQASLSEELVPSVDPERWNEVREWFIENGYEDCLPSSLKAASVRELWQMGLDIPHVRQYSKKKLSLTSR